MLEEFVEQTLNRARKWILAIGFFYLASAVVVILINGTGFDLSDPDTRFLLGTAGGLCACYIGLWWWAKRQPLKASIAALILFVAVQISQATLDPSTLWKGMLVKVLFVGALWRAIQAARAAERVRAELPSARVVD